MMILKWQKLELVEKNILAICILLILGGLIGIVAGLIVTPQFVMNHISDDGVLSQKGIDRLNNYKQLSVWGGTALSIAGLFVTFALLYSKENSTIFRSFSCKLLSRSVIFAKFFLQFSRIILLLLFSNFIVYILAYPNWIFGDNSIFWETLVKGIHQPFPVSIESMRFFPFGNIELNLLMFVGDRPFYYFLLLCIKFCLLIGSLWAIMVKLKNSLDMRSDIIGRGVLYLFLSIFIVLPNLAQIFSEVIYIETGICLLIAVYILLSLLGHKSQYKSYYLIAFVVGNILIYSKEPAFAVVFVSSLIPLVLEWRNISWKTKFFHIAMMVSAVSFLFIYYFAIIIPHNRLEPVAAYNTGRVNSFNIMVFTRELAKRGHYLTFIALPLAIYRLYITVLNIIYGREVERNTYVIDGFFYAGLVYIASFYFLNMISVYYFLPAYVLFIVSFYYYFILFYRDSSKQFAILGRIIISKKLLGILIYIVSISVTFFSFYHQYEYQRDVLKDRREQIPSVKMIVPQLEESQIILVIPRDDVFESEFDRTSSFNWFVTVATKLFDFLTEESLDFILYDPYGLKDNSSIRDIGSYAINSLDELDETSPVLAVCGPQIHNDDLPEEITSFRYLEEVKLPVNLYINE